MLFETTLEHWLLAALLVHSCRSHVVKDDMTRAEIVLTSNAGAYKQNFMSSTFINGLVV